MARGKAKREFAELLNEIYDEMCYMMRTLGGVGSQGAVDNTRRRHLTGVVTPTRSSS